MNREQFLQYYKDNQALHICWEFYVENFKPTPKIKNPLPPELFSHHFQNFAGFTKFSTDDVLDYYYEKFKVNILKGAGGEIIKLI